MKITRLEVFLVNPGRPVSFGTGWGQNTILVKVNTDSGISGLGEAFETGKAKTIESALYEYERWLVGKDPTEIVRNWYAYYRGARYPMGVESMAALSAVEIALWDIAGKACGLPVYRMLGGPFRDRVRAYASLYLTQPRRFDLEGPPQIQAARDVVTRGFDALKITPHPDDYVSLPAAQILEESVECVRQVREAVGPHVDIALDFHGRSLNPTEALWLAREVEKYRPMFLEEPALPDHPLSLAEVKAKTMIPVAGGARCTSRDRLREILESRAVHVMQPEPTANGGILETLKWGALCELFHVLVAPHHACGPVALMACIHAAACLPNFLIQECNVDLDAPFVHELYRGLPILENGHFLLPKSPGLGIELMEEEAARHPWRPFDRQVIIGPDGGIGM